MITRLRALVSPKKPAIPKWPQHVETPSGLLPVQVRINTRAKRLTMRLDAVENKLKLTIPPRTTATQVAAFLQSTQGWITTQAQKRLTPIVAFAHGQILPFRGADLRLEHADPSDSQHDKRKPIHIGDSLYVPGGEALFQGRVKRWLMHEALLILDLETKALAKMISKDVPQVRIGDYKSRWGSCAPDGRIAYSWRLILAPDYVRQSVVAHEVAHLIEANHGPKFWKLATQLYGKPHDDAREWLRINGTKLMRYGQAGGARKAENQA